MKTAKEIALIGIYTALLIGGQFVLSAVSGVEIVTVLLAGFCFYFGIKRGLLVANSFCVLRCFVFGFFPTVIILYLIYYNLFAVAFGLLGIRFKGELTSKSHIALILTAIFFVILFTALDDIITPLYYGFSFDTAKAYALASLTAVIPQTVCAFVTVLLLLPALFKVFTNIDLTAKK